MEKIKDLLDRVNIVTLIEKDFELRDYGTYSKGVMHDSLVVDHIKNYFYWNSLELRGNALDWLTIVKGLPVVDAVKQLKEIAGDIPKQKVFEYPTEINIYPKLLDLFYELGKDKREYWYSKGYTDATIDNFKLGYTGKCYVIPIIFNGVLLNFQCKVPATENKPKKIWGWASGLGVLPFNFDVLSGTNSTFIIESPGDAINVSQAGFSAVSQNGGSNNWNNEWNKYLINQREIIICYDNDEAGFLGATRLAKRFEDRARILVWDDRFRPKYGAGDFLKDHQVGQFLAMIANDTYTLKQIESFKKSILERYKDADSNS